MKCEGCGKKIKTLDDIQYYQQGLMQYKLIINEKGLSVEEKEFNADDGGEFYCAYCGAEIKYLNWEKAQKFVEQKRLIEVEA